MRDGRCIVSPDGDGNSRHYGCSCDDAGLVRVRADQVLVSRADLEALFKGFDDGLWVGGLGRQLGSDTLAVAARDNLYRALHGDLQQEVVDEVAPQQPEHSGAMPAAGESPSPAVSLARDGVPTVEEVARHEAAHRFVEVGTGTWTGRQWERGALWLCQHTMVCSRPQRRPEILQLRARHGVVELALGISQWAPLDTMPWAATSWWEPVDVRGRPLTPAAAQLFTCSARASSCDPPQDCDWPFCGCDEAASRVVETLQEAGWTPRASSPLATFSQAFTALDDVAVDLSPRDPGDEKGGPGAGAPPPKIRAPWTDEQVVALNRYQITGHVHPYTCANGCGELVATNDGWKCVRCSYTQDWAWEFSLDPAPDPLHGLLGEGRC